MLQLDEVAQEFTREYMKEYDSNFARPDLPINKTFVSNVAEAMTDIFPSATFDSSNKRPKIETPRNEMFLPNVPEVLAGLSAAIASGPLKELGEDIYKAIKKRLIDYYLTKHKLEVKGPPYILLKEGIFSGIKETINSPNNSGVIVIRGENKDRTILQAGKLRPLFKIYKGSFLILMDLIIEYEGSPKGLIEEETAPSFLPINVDFRKKIN
jgi:hypothetical protein